MAEDQRGDASLSGSGALYEHGEAGRKAAEEPVVIPGSGDREKAGGEPVGEEQAAENRENDPPA